MSWTFEWAAHLGQLYSVEASFRRASHTQPKPAEGGALSPSSTRELRIEKCFQRRDLRLFGRGGRSHCRALQRHPVKGDPNLLLIALVMHSYRDHLYLAGIPVFVQKLIFAALSPLARLRGYRLEVEPFGNDFQA